MAKTVADQFAEVLATAGVKRTYGIVGDSLNGLTDALQRQGKIDWIHVRRGGRRLRSGCRGASDGGARRLRRQLRAAGSTFERRGPRDRAVRLGMSSDWPPGLPFSSVSRGATLPAMMR
jgi:hypothetical protein